MAKNWSAAEAAEAIVKGKDKADIQDIGRRFPLFAVYANGGTEGLLEIIKALPEHMTARKVEAVLKAGIEEKDDEEEVEEKPKSKRGRKKKEEEKPEKAKRGRKKKEEEPEPDDDEDDEEEDEDDDGYDDMTLPQLRKLAKKEGINPKGMDKDEIIEALRDEGDDEEDEDEDDDWDV